MATTRVSGPVSRLRPVAARSQTRAMQVQRLRCVVRIEVEAGWARAALVLARMQTTNSRVCVCVVWLRLRAGSRPIALHAALIVVRLIGLEGEAARGSVRDDLHRKHAERK